MARATAQRDGAHAVPVIPADASNTPYPAQTCLVERSCQFTTIFESRLGIPRVCCTGVHGVLTDVAFTIFWRRSISSALSKRSSKHGRGLLNATARPTLVFLQRGPNRSVPQFAQDTLTSHDVDYHSFEGIVCRVNEYGWVRPPLRPIFMRNKQ